MPASRWKASRTCDSFWASWAAYSRSWKRQPPHAGKCAHGASTRCGPGRTTSTASASACERFTFVTRARTRSPGSPRRTKTTNPFSRATPLPPKASESTWSSSSWSLATGAAIAARLPRALAKARMRGKKLSPPRLLPEVEVADEVAEDRHVLAHVGARIRAPVGGRIEPLRVQEIVLDELRVGVEAQDLVVDEPAPGVGRD